MQENGELGFQTFSEVHIGSQTSNIFLVELSSEFLLHFQTNTIIMVIPNDQSISKFDFLKLFSLYQKTSSKLKDIKTRKTLLKRRKDVKKFLILELDVTPRGSQAFFNTHAFFQKGVTSLLSVVNLSKVVIW